MLGGSAYSYTSRPTLPWHLLPLSPARLPGVGVPMLNCAPSMRVCPAYACCHALHCRDLRCSGSRQRARPSQDHSIHKGDGGALLHIHDLDSRRGAPPPHPLVSRRARHRVLQPAGWEAGVRRTMADSNWTPQMRFKPVGSGEDSDDVSPVTTLSNAAHLYAHVHAAQPRARLGQRN